MTTVIKKLAMTLMLLGSMFGCKDYNEFSKTREAQKLSESEQEITDLMSSAIQYEMNTHDITSVSVSLIDEGKVFWSRKFGIDDKNRVSQDTSVSIYRVGSISKLFTEIAIMELIEEGRLSLYDPIDKYIPDFHPKNPYSTSVKIWHLLTHQSGLVREPPIGHYFDKSEPSLTETVASLNQTSLVFEPGEKRKYSNAGVAVLGRVLEEVYDKPFSEIIQEKILDPLNMDSSYFSYRDFDNTRLTPGILESYDDLRRPAPLYDLGESPAGNLYSTVDDLSKFMTELLKIKNGQPKSILTKSWLLKMWSTQKTQNDALNIGLGFTIDEVNGYKTVGHAGDIYGFVSDAVIIPELDIGVVISANLDQFTVSKLSRYALMLLSTSVAGQAFPEYPMSDPPSTMLRKGLAGGFQCDQGKMVVVRDHPVSGRLYLEGLKRIGELRRLNGNWTLEFHGEPSPIQIDSEMNTLHVNNLECRRFEQIQPAETSRVMAELIGQYGWANDYIRIYEWAGKLHARIEWRHHYQLEKIRKDVFAFPDDSLYKYEKIQFLRNKTGEPYAISLNGIVFPRRDFGEEFRKNLQIIVRQDVNNLRQEALSAEPPKEKGHFQASDLVNPQRFDPSIKANLAYASDDNLFGVKIYEEAIPLLQRPAAEALVKASDILRSRGFGLLIHDAYRPWYATRMFWDAVPQEGKRFVANPADGSRHNRGAAVDITLYDLKTGAPVKMPAGLDEVSMRSYFAFIGGTDAERWRRDHLYEAMTKAGFTVYEPEWWHFDYKGWENYQIQNVTFESLKKEG